MYKTVDELISSWDMDRYNNIQKVLLKKRIFHYTTIDSLLKILESNSLWATNCAYLNDKNELLELKKTIRKYLTTLPNDDKKAFSSFTNDVILSLNDSFRDRTFIISFSKSLDDISMWNYYGLNGVAIQFDQNVMLNRSANNRMDCIKDRNNIIKRGQLQYKGIGEVIYSDDAYYSFLKPNLDIILDIIKFENAHKKPSKEITTMLSKTILEILQLASFKKNRSYEYENEIRIVYRINEEMDTTCELFRIKNNEIVPFLIIVPNDIKDKLPIQSIMINPKNNNKQMVTSLNRLLKSFGYDVPVIKSKHNMR